VIAILTVLAIAVIAFCGHALFCPWCDRRGQW
jgi:hypothetical protein